MAAGDALLNSDIDLWFNGLASNDAMIQTLLPGGVFAEHPPEGQPVSGKPCLRWWEQAPGLNVKRQGDVKRILSRPSYVVCALDRQKGGKFSPAGSNGQLAAASRYLYTLFDGYDQTVALATGTFKFVAIIRSQYQMTESDSGDLLVMRGVWLDLKIQ